MCDEYVHKTFKCCYKLCLVSSDNYMEEAYRVSENTYKLCLVSSDNYMEEAYRVSENTYGVHGAINCDNHTRMSVQAGNF